MKVQFRENYQETDWGVTHPMTRIVEGDVIREDAGLLLIEKADGSRQWVSRRSVIKSSEPSVLVVQPGLVDPARARVVIESVKVTEDDSGGTI